MQYQKTFIIGLAILLGCCINFISNTQVVAQSRLSEKPKIKDFGKSLKKFEIKRKEKSKADENKNIEQSEETIKVKTDLVVSDVLVVDRKGEAILDLQESDFVVTEDETSQKIEVFSFGENPAIARSIVLIIDYSGSQTPYLNDSINAAKILIDKLSTQDKMAIVTDDVELLTDFTNDKALLKKKLDSLYTRVKSKQLGKSEQYSALFAVLNEMFDGDIRPIVLMQSDGDEFFALKRIAPLKDGESYPSPYNSRIFGILQKNYSYEDIYSVVSQSRATIYSIVPGFRFIDRSLEEQLEQAEIMNDRWLATVYFQILGINLNETSVQKQEITMSSHWYLRQQLALRDIAKLSGGYIDFLEHLQDAEKVYSRIFAAMNNRYLIGYYSSNLQKDSKQRRIKIEVKGHPEYTITGKKTYFAPERGK